METNEINEVAGYVLLPREEFDELTRARMGIDVIAASKGKYGFDSDVIHAVMKVFGHEFKEDEDAE